jgi:hypothetical protein
MDDLLNMHYTSYINSCKPHIPPCSSIGVKNIKSDVIDDAHFDIQDLKPTIKQRLGTGSATYENANNKIIAFINYEDFLNQLPAANVKGMKKPDFIAYDLENQTFFIVNELSQSSNPANKLRDARQQLHDAIFNFLQVIEIKEFIEKHDIKLCVFSNKSKTIKTPDDIAEAFNLIQSYLDEPIRHKFQPITKLGFEFIETAIVTV